MDFVAFVRAQIAFSYETFGPGTRFRGVLAHIRKELREVEKAKGLDVEEWADVIILAVDGAWRSGHPPEAIATALRNKLAKNAGRVWPDWRTAGPGPIEHVRD